MTTLPPLTHHEIFTLVAPFAQAGYQVDLAATDRPARRLVFRPREVNDAALPAAWQPLREQITLECGGRNHALLRTLDTAQGLRATLEGEGTDAAALLAACALVPPARQFVQTDGVAVPLQHRLLRSADPAPALMLKAARAALPGLVLQMRLSPVEGYSAEITLERDGTQIAQLPADLLEVLSFAYHRLVPNSRGWASRVELRGAGVRRGAAAETRLTQMVAHLARTLTAPPREFHRRHRLARWLIALHSTWPVAVAGGVLAFGISLQARGAAADSQLALLANVVPPLLLVAFFLRRETPRIGLPRWPRRLRADAWRVQG